MKILIDGDMFAFIACSSVEREIDWGNNVWTLHADLEEAKAHFIDKLNYCIETALMHKMYNGDFEVIFCLSDVKNFRKKVLPTYKANRIGKRKPVCYKGMIDWIKDTYYTVTKEGLEADDCMGIIATMEENKYNSIIISGDKDMKCLPAYVYNFISDEFFCITEEEADYWFYFQTLTGDSTDNYSGCPGIGKVNAERILRVNPTWEAVVSTYTKKGLTESDAIEQARVARILRASDFVFKTGKVKLWTP